MEAIEDARRDHVRRCKSVDHSEFTRDRANVVEGNVVDQFGQPIVGASVVVLSADEHAWSDGATHGETQRAGREEAYARTSIDGHYAVRGLDYGAKNVVVSKPGFPSVVVEEVVLADGYGASGVDALLSHGADLSFTFVDHLGSSAAGVPIQVLPSIPGTGRFIGESALDGSICVPIEETAKDDELDVLVGLPPAQVSIAIGPQRNVVVPLPEVRTLCLNFPGAADGPVDLTWIPHGAVQGGVTTTPAHIEGEWIRFVDAPRAGWDVLASTEDATAFATIHPESSLVVFDLRNTRDVRLAVDGRQEGGRSGIVSWYPTLSAAFGARDASDTRGRRASHPLTVTADLEIGQTMNLDLPFRGGFLFVEDEGRATSIVRVDETDGMARGSFRRRHPLLVETTRPYLPVTVQSRKAPIQASRSDRFAHLLVEVPEGPVVATTVFERGASSYPRGTWVGIEPATIAFSALDRPGEDGGCIYGFVTDHQYESGEPISRAGGSAVTLPG